jgi:hypothetical protein
LVLYQTGTEITCSTSLLKAAASSACRDKKVLSQQAERLQDALAQLEQQHVEQLAAKDKAHLQQLHEIRSELEQRQQDWVGASSCKIAH